MKTIFTTALLVAIMTFVFSGCAKKQENPTAQWQQASFDAWMARNEPAAIRYGDIYIAYIDTSARVVARAKGDTLIVPSALASFIQTDYTGTMLSNTVFVARNKAISELVGSYSIGTHYCPDFVLLQQQSATFSTGLSQAMQYVRQGDSVRVFIPLPLAYDEPFGQNSAYLTSETKYLNFPVIINMRIKAVTNAPREFEVDSVNNFAALKWGQSVADTLAKGAYIRKIKENPTGSKIGRDSVVYFYFAQYFTDDFLIKTNIDSLRKNSPEYTKQTTDNMSGFDLKPAKITVFNTELDRAYSIGLSHMRKGEIAEIVVISDYTESGVNGSPANIPEILPFQPRRYFLYALTDKEYADLPAKDK